MTEDQRDKDQARFIRQWAVDKIYAVRGYRGPDDVIREADKIAEWVVTGKST